MNAKQENIKNHQSASRHWNQKCKEKVFSFLNFGYFNLTQAQHMKHLKLDNTKMKICGSLIWLLNICNFWSGHTRRMRNRYKLHFTKMNWIYMSLRLHEIYLLVCTVQYAHAYISCHETIIRTMLQLPLKTPESQDKELPMNILKHLIIEFQISKWTKLKYLNLWRSSANELMTSFSWVLLQRQTFLVHIAMPNCIPARIHRNRFKMHEVPKKNLIICID